MKRSVLSKLAAFAIMAVIVISCKDKKPEFTIEGKISDADTTMLYLERRSLNETSVIDSVKLDKEGNYKFSEAALNYPEFYLLKLNGQTINLAVDSTETITINAPGKTFAVDYTVDGSTSSLKMKDVVIAQNRLSQTFNTLKKRFESKEISQDAYVIAVNEAINEYKTEVRDLIFSDYQSPAAYFALFQKVDGYLIFDPYDKKDLSVFQAVATVWSEYKSQSPRAEHLKNFTLSALKEFRDAANKEKTIVRLESTAVTDNSEYYNIALPDMHNKTINLSSLRGKAVILDFTAYNTDFSPAHNILINKVYAKYKDKIEVYQVSFDSDVHAWQNSAVNLPWICVRDEKSTNSELILKFNIQGFPTTYLVDKKGEIVKRISSTDDLEKEVQKLL